MRIINNRMDTHNDGRIACKDVRKEISGKKLVVGAKQLRKALISGTASCVYLAENADPAITAPIITLCQCNNITYAWAESMDALGRACGIDVGAAAAAAVD